MPYKSQKQRAYFHANAKKLKAQGVDIAEWDRSSKGLKLPKQVKKAGALDFAAIGRKLNHLPRN